MLTSFRNLLGTGGDILENNNKFFSLARDITFKYLFMNNKTKFFFNDLIEYYTGLDISKFHFIQNELPKGTNYVNYRIDTLLTNDNDDIIINVEMNNSYHDYIELRNRRYLHTIAGASKDNTYQDKRTVIQLNFNSSTSRNGKDISKETYQLHDIENNIIIDDFIIHNVFIPKEKHLCYNGNISKKLKLFQCDSYEEMRKITGEDKELNIVVDELERLNKDKYFGGLYDAEEDQRRKENSARIEGYDEGHEAGHIEEKQEIAIKMLEKNLDIQLISEITNLSIDEINKLK